MVKVAQVGDENKGIAEAAARWARWVALEERFGLAQTVGMSLRPSEQDLVETLQDSSVLPIPNDSPPASPSPAANLQLGEELGAGGMARVYRALESSLQRHVAVKVLKSSSDRAVRLFLSEAQISGRLEHPHIVPVHSYTVDPRGRHQLTMKLIEGRSWSDLIEDADAGLTLRDHLRILFTVCNAVAFAHDRGLIHRDIKPANVMVGAHGQIYLVDWGLAVALSDEFVRDTAILSVSCVDQPAGTPGFMAPELALGKGEDQGERTDVYLLGACLHLLLTGSPRHSGETIHQVIISAVESEPYEYDAAASPALALICNRAMAVDPGDRFPSVVEFQKALGAFMDFEQAATLGDKAAVLLGQVEAAVSDYAEADSVTRKALNRRIDRLRTEARFAFLHALESWEDVPNARANLARLSEVSLRHALTREDLPTALRLVDEVGREDLRVQTKELEARLEARALELEALRE